MATLTTNANKAFLPEEAGALIIKPVEEASAAIAVASNVSTNANFFRIPTVNTDPAAAWTGEGEEIDISDMTLGEVSTGFSKIAGLTVISVELAEDATPEAATMVGNGLARDIARKVDSAFFGAQGADTNQPEGLEDQTTGVVDAGAAFTGIDPFTEAQFQAEAQGATITAWVANPTDALALAKVKEGTGSNRNLLQPDPTAPSRRIVNGIPLTVSTAVTPGTVWGIPADAAYVVIRKNVTLDVDRSAFFTSDLVAVKSTMRVGFVFPQPLAIQKISLTV